MMHKLGLSGVVNTEPNLRSDVLCKNMIFLLRKPQSTFALRKPVANVKFTTFIKLRKRLISCSEFLYYIALIKSVISELES